MKEALKLALEALEAAEIDGNCEYGATEIIRKALAQPDLPQRTWVDLPDDVMWSADYGGSKIINLIYAKAIQSKLKERNA